MKIDENEIKIDNLKNIIRKTILAIQKYKNLDIILAGELNNYFRHVAIEYKRKFR